jgi:hypothetical protein
LIFWEYVGEIKVEVEGKGVSYAINLQWLAFDSRFGNVQHVYSGISK